MRKLIFMALLGVGLISAGNAQAQFTLAEDNAGNYVSWTNGSNGGYGFGPWTINATTGDGFAGAFIGNPSNAEITGMANPSFGLFANPAGSGASVRAERSLMNALQVGATLSLDWAVNWDSDGGNKGFNLYIISVSDENQVININQGGFPGTITINGVSMFSEYGTSPITFNFQRINETDLRVFATGRDGNEDYDETFELASSAITAFRFYASGMGAGDNRQPYFNNFRIESSTVVTSISGTPDIDAWRMLSSPVANTTYGTFLDGLWTQGFPGASAIETTPYPDNISSVRIWTENGLTAIGNITETIPAGQGFIAVIYEDDVYGTPGSFPKTISLTGTENASGSAPVHNGWALAGNPFAATISHANLDFSGFNDVVYVYDHTYTAGFSSPDVENTAGAVGGFRAYNGTDGSLTNGLIAPFQGFWVEATTGSDFEIASSAKSTSGNGTFLKTEAPSPSIQFAVRSEGRIGDAWLTFSYDGYEGRDRSDALSLKPMDLRPHLTVSTLLNDGTPLNINNLPSNFEGAIEIPLSVERFEVEDGTWVTASGPAEMVWRMKNVPDSWVLELVDSFTGRTINLTHDSFYNFVIEQSMYKVAVQSPTLSPQLASTFDAGRFLIRISDGSTTSAGIPSDLPASVTLAQNFPNPFNPTTNISYTLPENGHVRLAVYNLLGQQVAALVNGAMSAGSHTVTFDASSLSSGVYVYRLEAAGQVLSKRMTLMK